MKVFGPIPSRRLGKSLGINHIPPKICTYSCIYCQLGNTLKMQTNREKFYKAEEIKQEIEYKVKKLKARNEKIDYLSFVPDGEPTLDKNLGKIIDLIRPLNIKIAIITNSSLICDKEVRDDLCKADWVSIKVDAVTENIWKKIDRPFGKLNLSAIKKGILDFAKNFKGELVTETMLVNGINDDTEELNKIATFISEIKPNKSYISTPIRPPALKSVKPASEHNINIAYNIFYKKGLNVECTVDYEGNAFAFTGNAEQDILSIISVHPMREDAIKEFLKKAKANWTVIDKLIKKGDIIETIYGDNKFYVRKLKKNLII